MARALAHICCLDLDTFFVSVERLLDPSLIGKPVIVGASPGQRGVVTACSYEVRELGVHSGMSATDAHKLAPHAIYLPTRHKLYSPYALRVREVLERFTPAVQTASIDEFYLDFAGCERLYGRPGDRDADATVARVVAELRQCIQDEIGLPASGGIGATRSIAKIASRLAKPAGVFMVRPDQVRPLIGPMSVRAWPGIGTVTEQRLLDAGVQTIDQLLALPAGRHRATFGGLADSVRRGLGPDRATGLGPDRPAFREHDPVGHTAGSISNERTFMADLSDWRAINDQVRALAERVAWRARKRSIRARTITLKLRWSDFQTITRARTVQPTNDDQVLLSCLQGLLRQALTRHKPVRLLGVALSNLVDQDLQVTLPFYDDRDQRRGQAVDAVRQRFGYDAIRLGRTTSREHWQG